MPISYAWPNGTEEVLLKQFTSDGSDMIQYMRAKAWKVIKVSNGNLVLWVAQSTFVCWTVILLSSWSPPAHPQKPKKSKKDSTINLHLYLRSQRASIWKWITLYPRLARVILLIVHAAQNFPRQKGTACYISSKLSWNLEFLIFSRFFIS